MGAILRAAVLLLLVFLPLPGTQNFTCASCHQKQAQSQPKTPMAHALERPAQCSILQKHPLMTFREGAYSFQIATADGKAIYTVTDGVNTVTTPIGWALGQGGAGQTYIYQRDGRYYESRVSYFEARGGLDITMGQGHIAPKNLDEAAGRPLAAPEAQACFECHDTHAVVDGALRTDTMIPGVQCGHCHQNAAQHLQAMQNGDSSTIPPRLAKLSTGAISNFCGQCHRTWDRVTMQGPHGILNVRFQPYRLANSKCWDESDARISCIACHDPHQDLVRDAAAYDSKCLACHHSSGAHSARADAPACPVAKSNCTTCHMPKLDLPGAHAKFTDHQIRIVKVNEAYPN